MPRVTFVAVDGTLTTVECRTGTTVRQCAQLHGVRGIYAECGGQLSCATCHVYVAEEHLQSLPKPSPDEEEMLEATASDRFPNSRLSCQIVLGEGVDDLTVYIPEVQR